MTDQIILALPKLYDDVVARFALEGTNVPNVFGWREPAKQLVGPRIAWIPGDPAGAAGEIVSARNPGRNPRPLATLDELFTVEISSADPTKPEDERGQYQATRVLHDAWYRAVYLAARGTFAIQSVAWITTKKERRYGTALRVVCTIEAMVPDLPLTAAPVDVHADIEVSELDVTEHLEAPDPA